MLFVTCISAFINNTPVVVIMIPIVFTLSKVVGVSSSKLLIPLSFSAILGGMCTLVGSSTNLLADGVVRKSGLEGFGIFDITLPGLCMALIGMLYMVLFGHRYLPEKTDIDTQFEDDIQHFLTDLLIPEGSSYIGKTIAQIGFKGDPEKQLLDLIRGDVSMRRQIDTIKLQAGDRIVLETSVREFLDLRETGDVDIQLEQRGNRIELISTKELIVKQAIVGPRSRFVGRRIGDLNFRRRYGIYILAIHRQNEKLNKNLDQVRLEFGDVILFEGPEEGIQQLFDTNEFVNLKQPRINPYRRAKAWIAILAMVSVMVLSALGIMSIVTLALMAAAAVIAFGCVESREAYAAVEWRILSLIFGMLTLSVAMQKTGAVTFLVAQVYPFLSHMPPIFVLACVYGIASIFTEMISNNAVVVLITPIVIVLAQQLGFDPKPFIVAVMFGSSASFATPIGYQTNTLVYGAGGYRFMDFIKVGLPLNLLLWMTAIVVIPIFWEL